LLVVIEIPECGDDLEAVLDWLRAAAALPQDLPVVESGDDVFDVGPDPVVCPVVIFADDLAGVVAPGCVIDAMPRSPPSPRAV
jgi:hypothetical protein